MRATCEPVRMAQTVCVLLSASDRKRLETIASDRNQPRKHIERVEGGTCCDEPPAQCSKWQDRCQSPGGVALAAAFRREGPDGLLRDKTRKPGKPPIPAETVARAVALTCGEPPPGATHGPVGRCPRPSGSRCARCSTSGRRISCSRIGCAVLSARAIRSSPSR
jgi:hypothetical protein